MIDELVGRSVEPACKSNPVAMKSAECEELLSLIDELSTQFPEMRFGQLICNLAMSARGAAKSATWDAEDKELIAAARRMLPRESVATGD